MALSETVDDCSLRVTDREVDPLSGRHVDSAKFECLRTEDMDSRGWAIDQRAMAPCRNGEVHSARALIAQIPIGKGRSQADHSLGCAGAYHHKVNLIDSAGLLQLEKPPGELDEKARIVCSVEVPPRDSITDCVSGAKDRPERSEPVDDLRICHQV